MDAEEGSERRRKVPKVARVKNKSAAPVQITAEQLMREAKERQLEVVAPPIRHKVTDAEELNELKLKRRREFEDNIRKNRQNIINWIKYAQFEESQAEIQRARSVFERALDVDHRNVTLWLKYAEMEMRHKQINHARNIWDRAVVLLPRVNQFWYKYTYMEEMLGNISGCRRVFERWMEWEPEEQAWFSYIKMELRYKEVNRARSIYEAFLAVHPHPKNWIKFAKFEVAKGTIENARIVYERAIEYFGDEGLEEKLVIAFAKFEEGCKELERVRVVYKYAIDHIPKEKSQELMKEYARFEKRFGDRAGIEDVIVSKRRFQYEEEIETNPYNYDAWFDYLRLVESDSTVGAVRDAYERAIANIPPLKKKTAWERYIYLWVSYAAYEELTAKDEERTRQVYKACLDLIPHQLFTFSKIWMLYSKFEVRQKNLSAARKTLGFAIGKYPKNSLFKGYLNIELQLREFDRCRILYEKHLEFAPTNCVTWIKYAEMEATLGDNPRARAIFELAVNQQYLDMPEVLWKAYLDFEIDQGEYKNVRSLYNRLLGRTKHTKVWKSFAEFEASTQEEGSIDRARSVFKQADKIFAKERDKDSRLVLLEAWSDFERRYGDRESQRAINQMMPRKVAKRRKVVASDGSDAGWEEYFEYLFPDEEATQPNFKLLQLARNWKLQQQQQQKQLFDQDGDVPVPSPEEPEVSAEHSSEQGRPSSPLKNLQASTLGRRHGHHAGNHRLSAMQDHDIEGSSSASE